MKTERQRGLTLVSGSGGVEDNGYVSTPFGPLRANLIISQRTQYQALEELVSCLESKVAMLESKYLEACDTLIDVTELLVKHWRSINDTTTTS